MEWCGSRALDRLSEHASGDLVYFEQLLKLRIGLFEIVDQ